MIKSPPNIFYDNFVLSSNLNNTKVKNLAFVVAVSDFYIEELHKNWDKLKEWDVCVLTNRPEEFKDAFYVEEYKDFIFSYVQKFTFLLRTCLKFQRGGFLLDADDLVRLTPDFYNTFHYYTDFHTVEYWWTPRDQIKNSELGVNLQRYADEFGIDLLNIDPVCEQAFYVPYSYKLVDILYEIERIKPIMEYTSLFNDHYNYLGHGEGLAVALALKIHNTKIKLFDTNPFNLEYWNSRIL